MSLAEFFYMGNIDMWLLVGVLTCIAWILFKAISDDYERHEERIRALEESEIEIYSKLYDLKYGISKKLTGDKK